MTDEPLRTGATGSGRSKRRAARRRRLIKWGVVLALLAVLIAAVRPTYRRLKARRANQIAVEADRFAASGNLKEAAGKYRAALQLDPFGYRPLQGAARFAAKTHRPEAADLWEQVNRLPHATVADRQNYAAVLLQNNRVTTAEKIVSELLKSDPDPTTLSLAAAYAHLTGDDQKAIEFARLTMVQAPDDDRARSELAQLLAGSADQRQRAEARNLLWQLASREGSFKKSAVEALARAPDLSTAEEARVLTALHSLPNPMATEALLAADLELKLNPQDGPSIFDGLVTRYSKSALADMVAFADWLNTHKQAERVLALIPPESAVKDATLLQPRLDALADLDRWPEIDQIFARSDLSLDPAVAEAFRARSALARKAPLDADLHWNKAIMLASNSPARLRFIASFAEHSHARPIAQKTYEQLARFPEHAAFAYRGSQRMAGPGADANATRAIAQKVAATSVDDPNAQDQLAYLNLLLGAEIDANLAEAKKRVAQHPTRLSFRVTAALAFLRKHDASSALAQFEGPPIDWSRTPPAWRAVYAAALAVNDDAEAAQQMVATIPLGQLNKQECELIGQAGH
ncbi:MAG: hypothetical protein ABI795_06800 [Chthoniobacterales bacterium]